MSASTAKSNFVTARRRERQSFKPWTGQSLPARVLLIRFHAMGDVALTLPEVVALHSRVLHASIDYLTTPASASLVDSLHIFNEVLQLADEDDRISSMFAMLRHASRARSKRYDIIIDLQRNWVSRFIRRIAAPTAWGEFDRFAPRTAADRVSECFRKLGFERLLPNFRLPIRERVAADASALLQKCGRNPARKLIVLNPAGLWETRNWPIEHFAALARLWREHEPVQFVLLGTERIRSKAEYLTNQLGSEIMNLVEQTNPGEALAILAQASAIITEDSGLMHMAWAAGVPTIALFGSTYHTWSAPPPGHARSFHSGDLPCGQCMEPACRFGDVHCLTRFTPQEVYQAARQLIDSPQLIGTPA